MMYSYYTMTLLKLNCPWKKYLTMAQLAQFTTVVVYSMVSLCVLPKGTHWKHYTALTCQCGEMISLFVLFMHFYNKKYSKAGAPGKGAGASKKTTTDDKGPQSPVRASETSDTGSEGSTDTASDSDRE